MKQYLLAIATLIGTIVGAGIFAIPFALSRAGILSGFFYFLTVGAIVLLVSWLYGEIILRTRGHHRLVGYAEKYLGAKGKFLAFFSTIFGFYGSLVVYMILGGKFLHVLFGAALNKEEFFCCLFFFVLGILAIFFGLKMVSITEFLMSLLLVGTVLLLAGKSWPFVQAENFSFFDWRYLFLAYGVIFYSFLGSSALPEMRQILRGQERRFKPAIFWGIFIPAVLYLIFSLAIVGVSGPQTSEEAIDGLIPFLGGEVVKLGAVFGFLAVFSSFIVLGLNLKKVFQFDLKLNHWLSWFLVAVVPLALFLIGIQNFISVIIVVGVVMGGLEGILLVLIYKKADKTGDRRPEYDIKVPNFVLWFLGVVFVVGIIYQFIYL